jgi:CheY-like chemotaxis protein
MEVEKPTVIILVVEDDPSLQQMLAWDLEDLYTVVITSNGKEALEKLETITPAIILLDLMMPVMDGFAFLQELEKRGKKSICPIIVLTAFANMEERVLQLQRDGYIATFLIKPFRFKDLLLTEIVRLLNEHVTEPVTTKGSIPLEDQ